MKQYIAKNKSDSLSLIVAENVEDAKLLFLQSLKEPCKIVDLGVEYKNQNIIDKVFIDTPKGLVANYITKLDNGQIYFSYNDDIEYIKKIFKRENFVVLDVDCWILQVSLSMQALEKYKFFLR